MKKIFTLCAIILVAGGILLWRATQLPTFYGTFAGAPQASVIELVEHPKAYVSKTVTVEEVIRQQCRSMGCFFFFRQGNTELRVELKDIAMTAPMREGKKARVEGQIVPYGDGYQLLATAVRFL